MLNMTITLRAAHNKQTMIKEWNVVIPSLTGEKERRAYVYLPVGYGSGERYPVMYMFDGHNLFSDSQATYGRSWRLGEYLDKNKTKLIVAAVECNTEGNCRLSEYSPVDFTFSDGSFIEGKGKLYMDWLTGEFKPCIDKNFSTLPERSSTAIGGSSMGGLMTLYALAEYGKYFSRGAALSPSLWIGGDLTQNIKNAKFANGTYLYTDYGSREFSNHSRQKKAFAETCALLIEKGVILTARVVKGAKHCEEAWEKRIPDFIKALEFN